MNSVLSIFTAMLIFGILLLLLAVVHRLRMKGHSGTPDMLENSSCCGGGRGGCTKSGSCSLKTNEEHHHETGNI
jgi:hypothetical protein